LKPFTHKIGAERVAFSHSTKHHTPHRCVWCEIAFRFSPVLVRPFGLAGIKFVVAFWLTML
jgi:hypothetical protein